jgi:hypothetical protein
MQMYIKFNANQAATGVVQSRCSGSKFQSSAGYKYKESYKQKKAYDMQKKL